MDEGIACVCGCGRPRGRWGRGLADGCFKRLERRVKAGETTWLKLEAQNRCLPKTRRRWGFREEAKKC